MNLNECCSVVNLCGCPICVFHPDETYDQDWILGVFIGGTPKGDDVIFDDIACVFPDKKALPKPQDTISFPSTDYVDKVCLVFRSIRKKEKVFDGVYLYDKSQNKHIRQHISVSVTNFGKVFLGSEFPAINFGALGNGLFSNVSIGISHEGVVCLKKEKRFGEKTIEWFVNLVPIALIGFSCFWAYKTICVRAERIEAKVSWQVLLGPDGTNSVASSFSGSVAGNNLTNLNIRVAQ